MSFEITIDEHFKLKLPDESQTDEIYRLVMENYDHLHRWLLWCDEKYDRDSVKSYIEQANFSLEVPGGQLSLMIEEDGRPIGGAGIHGIDAENRSAEMGYWIGEKHSGKGIVTRSAIALLRYGFESMKLNRMAIKCVPENERSRAIPERLGFVFENIEREAGWLHDRFVDHAVYSMLASEWKEKFCS